MYMRYWDEHGLGKAKQGKAIHFGLPIHTDELALYTQYFPESCEQNHRHITRVGFQPTTFVTLEQCLTNKTHRCKGKTKVNIFHPDAIFLTSIEASLVTSLALSLSAYLSLLVLLSPTSGFRKQSSLVLPALYTSTYPHHSI